MGLDFIGALVLIAGGLLAASTVIVARRPDAQQVINRLVPFQAMIGVALLAFGFINMIRLLTSGTLGALSRVPFFFASHLCVLGCSVLLGFLFGMPLISRLVPGSSSAEQKAAELAQKIAAFQIMLGLLGIVASLVYIVFRITGKLM
jgi:hypothetical protein